MKGGFIPTRKPSSSTRQGRVLPKWLTEKDLFINILDAVYLHIAALILPDVQNERVFGFIDVYNSNDILAVLRKQCPDRQFMSDFEVLGRAKTTVKPALQERALQLMRRMGRDGFISFEESIRANAAKFV